MRTKETKIIRLENIWVEKLELYLCAFILAHANMTCLCVFTYLDSLVCVRGCGQLYGTALKSFLNAADGFHFRVSLCQCSGSQKFTHLRYSIFPLHVYDGSLSKSLVVVI